MSASIRVNPSDQWATDEHVVKAGTAPRPGAPVLLAGADAFRLSVEILADADNSDTVWIVPSANQTTGGRPLRPGAGFTLNTAAPVFGYVKAGTLADQLVYATPEGSVC